MFKTDRPVVMVANRLPVSKTEQGSWRTSTGGLVTAMRPVMENTEGVWVGWNGGDEDVPSRVSGLDIDLVPVSLSHAQIQGYYHGFSNRTLWPLFHDLIEQPVFDRRWWEIYEQVNRRFAERAGGLQLAHDSPLFWVQDYHLTLAPSLLREQHPQAHILYFLHIPFPPPELFARLPWRDRILEGLLGADLVSFHTDPYRENFLRSVARVQRFDIDDAFVVLPDGRRVGTAAHPISVDTEAFEELAHSPDVEAELSGLHEQFVGRKVILGVDRLDYTKGILERFNAIELLLERRPDLRGRIAFVQIAVPSRQGVQEYRELRRDVEREVGRINGRFTEPGSDVPVHYLHRGVPRPRLVAYYRLADVAAVTPLKDGMNLIAKEFVVCQASQGGSGVLVLSEFTGSCRELDEAVLCNPFDVEGLSRRIEHALELDPGDARGRLERMAATVKENDVFAWVDRQLEQVETVAEGRSGS